MLTLGILLMCGGLVICGMVWHRGTFHPHVDEVLGLVLVTGVGTFFVGAMLTAIGVAS